MMKIMLILMASSVLFGGVIDGIALKVDGNIITLYEIDEMAKTLKISKEKARETLINKKMRDNEIKRLKISVNDTRLNDEISNIAAGNKITIDALKKGVESQGVSFETYKEQLREHIINRELIQKILQTNSNIASDEELEKYYNTHKNEFKIPTKFSVTSYLSNSDTALQKVLSNPMARHPQVETKNEEVDVKNLPPQILNIFLNTPEKSFTPVLNSGSTLVVFFIKSKSGLEVLPFEDVKQSVVQKYAQVKEQEILSEYFKKIKATTKIEIIRE